jgi:hypothetical protein
MVQRERRIEEIAYLLWEQEGRPDGQSERFWHAAETQFAAEVARAELAAAVAEAKSERKASNKPESAAPKERESATPRAAAKDVEKPAPTAKPKAVKAPATKPKPVEAPTVSLKAPVSEPPAKATAKRTTTAKSKPTG